MIERGPIFCDDFQTLPLNGVSHGHVALPYGHAVGSIEIKTEANTRDIIDV